MRISELPFWFWIAVAAGIVLLQGIILSLMGQPPICTCGHVDLWYGSTAGSGNSQHLFDWYTFSHIVHGLIFYAVLRLLFPRMPFMMRLALAVGIEASWEVLENTPWIINKYRETALAHGYSGDSIINSVFDTLSAITGFLLARRLPVKASVALAVALELFAGFMVRDNLILNVISFIHRFDFISKWQEGSL